jgi:1-deoxy-D-xylulose-5-phosphate reductoisomerase
LGRKRIAILGSTGSIGTQALEVVQMHPEELEVTVLTASSQCDLLIQQALAFQPKVVVIAQEEHYAKVVEGLRNTTIEVLSGHDALSEVVQMEEIDMVLTALVGAAGLRPTLAAIQAGKDIALANKETLVVGGELVMRLAVQHGIQIIPVDSEHSAIFQCLKGENKAEVEKIILTASGGPFRGKDRAFLETVGPEQALRHPNWVMGAKITIDSATLMNKGLEVIEAKWLFGLQPNEIEVLVHPQSIIHSMVQFCDGAVLAQLGLPDMKVPIQYALTYPERCQNDWERLDFMKYPHLTFELPDRALFPALGLAFDSLREGGNRSGVLNAANEVAVSAFLNKQIGFLTMGDVLTFALDTVPLFGANSLEECIEADQLARSAAQQYINRKLN